MSHLLVGVVSACGVGISIYTEYIRLYYTHTHTAHTHTHTQCLSLIHVNTLARAHYGSTVLSPGSASSKSSTHLYIGW